MPGMEQNDGSIPAGPLLHVTLSIVPTGLAEALPFLTEGSRNTPATALPAPGGTQRHLASAHMVRALLSHRHSLGMTIKLRHFMGERSHRMSEQLAGC